MEMQDDKSLQEYNIGKASTIRMYLRVSATAEIEMHVSTPSGKRTTIKFGRQDTIEAVKMAVQRNPSRSATTCIWWAATRKQCLFGPLWHS